jgi:Response regulator containing CheY-like receiver, AAA-type ATPase, and DNA-binding domains
MNKPDLLPVILIDDEHHIRVAAGQTLELAGYEVTTLERAEPALERVSEDWPGVVITDINPAGNRWTGADAPHPSG